jgi:hypothetical protein
MTVFLKPAEVKAALPFPVSERALRQKLRASGLCIKNGHQIALPADKLAAFIASAFGPTPPTLPRRTIPPEANSKNRGGVSTSQEFADRATKMMIESGQISANGKAAKELLARTGWKSAKSRL